MDPIPPTRGRSVSLPLHYTGDGVLQTAEEHSLSSEFKERVLRSYPNFADSYNKYINTLSFPEAEILSADEEKIECLSASEQDKIPASYLTSLLNKVIDNSREKITRSGATYGAAI
jgi:hypothetical protein